MTIHKEEPGLWVAYCDSCGTRVELDTDPEEGIEYAEDDLEHVHEWRVEPPVKVKYAELRPSYTEVYQQHFCLDC